MTTVIMATETAISGMIRNTLVTKIAGQEQARKPARMRG